MGLIRKALRFAFAEVGTDDEGYELHPIFRAKEGEIVVDKWTFGAFASTHLERELLARGVKRILLCALDTAWSLSFFVGFRVF